MERLSRTPARRGIAAAVSGVLVSGAIAGTVVGAAAPANADPVDVTKDFTAVCNVKAGGLGLGKHDIKAHLATQAEVPLVPGTTSPAQDVSVTLTMPKSLQKATTDVLGITHAKGGSPDSAVDITMPVAPQLGVETVTNRIPLQKLTAPKAKVPKKGKWKITSSGTVPELDVPGFAGNGSTTPPPSSAATLSLAPKFTIKATLFAKNGKKFKSTMNCTVPKAERPFDAPAPIFGPFKADTVDLQKNVWFNKPAKVQLVLFMPGTSPMPSVTQPANGTVELGPGGVATYTPNKNYVGKDSFTYTAKDSTGESTSTVTLKVHRAKSKLTVKAPKKVRVNKKATVRVKVATDGAAKGKIFLKKGKRVLDTGKVKAGKATLFVKRMALKPGKHTLRIRYDGSTTARPGFAKFDLRVLKKR